MADTRINALSTATSSVSDDFVPIDGTTNGTRKLSAYSPTFGGNATVAGSLTASGTTTADGLATSGFFGGSKRVILGYNTSSDYGFIASVDTGVGWKELQLNPSGGLVKVPSTTASTSTSSGALVVSGGVGVGGAINAGSSISSWTGTFVARSASANPSFYAWTENTVADRGVLGFEAASSTLKYRAGGYSMSTGTEVFSITNAGVVSVLATTASTSTSSGALVVSGGVGVAKELYVGSATESNSNTTGGLVVSGGLGLALNLNMGGRLFINNTGAANGALSSSAVVATFGADATLGGLSFNVKGFPSATAGSRYVQLTAADSADFRELRINDGGGNVLLGGASSTVKIGGSLQVGNAYVAGAPTATGYIVIKDSTGTSYKIPAVAL